MLLLLLNVIADEFHEFPKDFLRNIIETYVT